MNYARRDLDRARDLCTRANGTRAVDELFSSLPLSAFLPLCDPPSRGVNRR